MKVPLQRAIAAGTLAQQLLFTGASGLGKTTLARIVAAAVLCTDSVDDEPCGSCVSCTAVFDHGGSHPDVTEFDAASHGNKDDIRDLAQRAMLAPMQGSKRVFIIDEAHGLSNPGGQAFLKLLEEPPEHVVFMLATTDPQKMLATNRSRCITFELSTPPAVQVADNLVRVAVSSGASVSPEVALELVAATDPALGVRGTVMTLEKVLAAAGDGSVSSELVAEVLARPSREQVLELLSSGSLSDAFDRLDVLLERFGVAAFARRAAEVVSDELVSSARSGSGDVPFLQRALDEFHQLMSAPSLVGARVVLSRLVDPVPAADRVARDLASFERALEELQSRLVSLSGQVPDVSPSGTPAVSSEAGSSNGVLPEAAGVVSRRAATAEVVAADGTSGGSSDGQGSAGAPPLSLPEMFNVVSSSVSGVAAVALRRTAPTIVDGRLVVPLSASFRQYCEAVVAALSERGVVVDLVEP